MTNNVHTTHHLQLLGRLHPVAGLVHRLYYRFDKAVTFRIRSKISATRKNISLLFSAVSALTIGVLITDVITFGGKNITIDVPAQKEGIPSITPSVVCLPVPQDIITSINQGLTIQGGGTFRNAQAVKSTDYKSVYFISGDLQGSGLEGDEDIATFARNGELDGSGMIIAVDAVANEFSDWADGRTMRLPMTMSDSGASQSQDCVSEK